MKHVVGVGRTEAATTSIPRCGSGVIDEASRDAARAVPDADLVLLGTPVGQMPEVMAQIAPRYRRPPSLPTPAARNRTSSTMRGDFWVTRRALRAFASDCGHRKQRRGRRVFGALSWTQRDHRASAGNAVLPPCDSCDPPGGRAARVSCGSTLDSTMKFSARLATCPMYSLSLWSACLQSAQCANAAGIFWGRFARHGAHCGELSGNVARYLYGESRSAARASRLVLGRARA